MTPLATQAGIARTVGIAPKTRRVIFVVFCFVALTVVVAGFGPATVGSQEPVVDQIETGEQAGLVDPPALPDEATAQPPPTIERDENQDDDEKQWRPLLDEQLSLWEVFTGIPHKSVEIEGVPRSKSHDCRKGTPFGLGDPKNVYSVTMVDGAPVLHVSGEMYAGLTTLEEFKDYHFSTEFKWGEKTWPPRRKTKRDSGILFHCTGKHGAFWNAWMRCIECQVQEGDCGDLIPLAGTSAQVRATPETAGKATPQHSPDGKWCSIGPRFGKWGAKRYGDHEMVGEWNRIEIHTVGDKAVFSVNGHPVMHLKNARVGKHKSGKPLTQGKIQVQSEAAEVWYRDMKIRTIAQLPAELAAHYDDP